LKWIYYQAPTRSTLLTKHHPVYISHTFFMAIVNWPVNDRCWTSINPFPVTINKYIKREHFSPSFTPTRYQIDRSLCGLCSCRFPRALDLFTFAALHFAAPALERSLISLSLLRFFYVDRTADMSGGSSDSRISPGGSKAVGVHHIIVSNWQPSFSPVASVCRHFGWRLSNQLRSHILPSASLAPHLFLPFFLSIRSFSFILQCDYEGRFVSLLSKKVLRGNFPFVSKWIVCFPHETRMCCCELKIVALKWKKDF